ncbi:MAG: antibiotic biosynthesis monooxygenase family protein [Candidatus Angelobacter sp.]
MLSKFKVANGMTPEVKQAFLNRPHQVESASGFIRLDVVSPHDQPDEIWLLTYWSDFSSYEQWHKSPAHHESHHGIPRGLKLDPASTQVRVFEHICS